MSRVLKKLHRRAAARAGDRPAARSWGERLEGRTLFAITGLFSTGVDDAGAVLPADTTDPHYTLVSTPSGGPAAVTVDPTQFPLVFGPWTANGPASAWIAPHSEQFLGEPPGTYDYRTTFNLGGDPSTAKITGEWAVDNSAILYLNGVNTGITAPDFLQLYPFALTGGFQAGTNTLDFVVTNAGVNNNPTGIQVHFSSATVQAAAPTLNVAPAAATYGGSVALSASLAVGGSPLAGETVAFALNGTNVGTAVTGNDGVATLNGVSLGGLGAGSYANGVTASFAGDVINGAATGSSSLTVSPAPLTVSADSFTQLVGQANPTLTGSIIGIQNNDPISVSFSTDATQQSAVGTYAIVPTLSDPAGKLANYSVTINSGSLTITYGVQVLTDLTDAKNSGSTLPIRLQVVDGTGQDLSTVSLLVTGVGISTSSSNSPTGAAVSPGNSDPNGLFRFVSAGDGSYQFNLKLVDSSGAGLAPGTYTFYFQIAGDSVTHSLQFVVD